MLLLLSRKNCVDPQRTKDKPGIINQETDCDAP